MRFSGRFKWLPVAMAAIMLLCAAAPNAYQQYIEKYSSIAVSEMYRSGVPASITLAQGLLESGAGRSRLATEGNNHFGIKCHNNWTGRSLRADDDAPQECFRAYDTAEESFRDHSDFLRYRDRYKFLFEYDITDYKAWAYGLKKAGYATSPVYATKLIEIIEKYDLAKYDLMEPGQTSGKSEAKAEIPAPPARIEAPVAVTSKQGPDEVYTFSLERKCFEKNGVKCTIAAEGESYESIAVMCDIRPVFLIYRYNDTSSKAPALHAGDIVYLKPKAKSAPYGLDKHVVDEEVETLWQISQRYGIKLSSLVKYNAGTDAKTQLREGDIVNLRKPE